ncbi:MAG: hypothetical protein KIT16_00785 [Rhodospirillaceae bacterium]|nr:hypothetical protein [Rhodospirillaceae bacterium]
MHDVIAPPLHAIEARRAPPKRVQCLLPVWGDKYVQEFLDWRLPTWLAPGNIPALAAALPTEFVFLTGRDDEACLKQHPGYERLSRLCAVRTHYIDRLITGINHSTTLTLAFAEAVRAMGDAMLDTCFFFLVSDYVVADGAFGHVLKRMLAGASAIQAGNFQVDEASGLPWLKRRLDDSPHVLALPPAEMLHWGLAHLHPATAANFVNIGLSHNAHTNRLFWRVDHRTILGRFFLLHMICIRPEITDFVVGSSADYSFIPEMCPSGNVEIMTDSDEYLVVEMQPRGHETDFLRPGPLAPRRLGHSLNEWTTARHRQNAATSIFFHAGPLPETLAGTVAEADRFLAETQHALHARPKPHRRHPYWAGALASIRESTGVPLDRKEWAFAFGLPHPERMEAPLASWALRTVPALFYSRPPRVRVWHPRKADYDAVNARLDAKRKTNAKLLLLADAPTVFSVALADGGVRTTRMRIAELMRRSTGNFTPLAAAFDLCLIEIEEFYLDRMSALLDRVAPLMAHHGAVLISLLNRRAHHGRRDFTGFIAQRADHFLRPYALAMECTAVRPPTVLWRCVSLQSRLWQRFRRHRSLPAGIAFTLLSPAFAICNTLMNVLARKSAALPGRGSVSSVLFEISIDTDAARALLRDFGERRQRQVVPDPNVGKPPDLNRILHAAGSAG